jgi:hypothetical protein
MKPTIIHDDFLPAVADFLPMNPDKTTETYYLEWLELVKNHFPGYCQTAGQYLKTALNLLLEYAELRNRNPSTFSDAARNMMIRIIKRFRNEFLILQQRPGLQ